MTENTATKKCEESTKPPDTKLQIRTSVEYEAFTRVRETIQPSVEQVIDSVAMKLWAKEVIPEKVFEKIFDVAHFGASWRSNYFMKVFCKKVEQAENEEPSHKKAKQMIADLVDVLRKDRALNYVAELVADCDDHNDLRNTSDDIATSLDSSLMQIAPSIYGKGIISDVEFSVIVDPSAEHSQAATNAVLTAVAKAIKLNPRHLDTFKGILVGMGKPTSELAIIIAETESSLKPLKE